MLIVECSLTDETFYFNLDHFHKRYDVVDTYLCQGNKIDNHPRRLTRFVAPIGFVDWKIFLIELESHRI